MAGGCADGEVEEQVQGGDEEERDLYSTVQYSTALYSTAVEVPASSSRSWPSARSRGSSRSCSASQ